MGNIAEWKHTEQIGTRIDYQVIAQRRCQADGPEMRDLVRLAEIEAQQAELTREAYQIIRRRINADLEENTDHERLIQVAKREAATLEGVELVEVA